MANKFDTNPLDPEFPRRAMETQQTATLPNLNGKTKNFAQPEDQTRKFENSQYGEMFGTQNYQPPTLFQNAKPEVVEKPTSRKVAKIGLPENVMMVLPYIPWGVGLIAGLLELVFVPSSESKVRFHAAQGLALQIGILLIGMLLNFGGNLYGLVEVGSVIFQLATFVFLIVSGIKVWKGQPVHVEAIEEMTNFLEEKIRVNK
jgi:uncharacterized membrane protein